MIILKPNAQRAQTAISLIWVVLAIEMFQIASSVLLLNTLHDQRQGLYVSENTILFNDLREGLCAMLYLVAFLLSGITFIKWFRRAYANLHQMVDNSDTLICSEGWAAGSWFVPILNLFRPYQIMKDLYVEAKQVIVQKGHSISAAYKTTYVGWWWMLWLLSGFISQIQMRYMLRSDDSVDEQYVSTLLEIGLGLFGIPLALITIKVIKDYAKVESLLAQIFSEQDSTHETQSSSVE